MAKKPLAPLKFPPGPELKPLYDRVIEIATRYPGIDISRSYGTPSIKVAGKVRHVCVLGQRVALRSAATSWSRKP